MAEGFESMVSDALECVNEASEIDTPSLREIVAAGLKDQPDLESWKWELITEPDGNEKLPDMLIEYMANPSPEKAGMIAKTMADSAAKYASFIVQDEIDNQLDRRAYDCRMARIVGRYNRAEARHG